MSMNLKPRTTWVMNALIVIGVIQTFLPELQALIPEVPERIWGIVTLILGLSVRIARALSVVPVVANVAEDPPK